MEGQIMQSLADHLQNFDFCSEWCGELFGDFEHRSGYDLSKYFKSHVGCHVDNRLKGF